MLTVKEVAQRVGVSCGLVYQWIQAKVLPHYRLGLPGRRGAIRVSEGDLEAFLQTQKQQKEPEAAPPTPSQPHPRLKLKHVRVK